MASKVLFFPLAIFTLIGGQHYCAVAQTCTEPKYQYFCAETKKCHYNSQSCNGECLLPSTRYCPRYLIDDYIGDGQGSCIKESRPCGDECPNGLYFCLATFSCIRDSSHCPCPAGKWGPHYNTEPGATYCGGLKRCELNANQRLPSNIGRCAICVRENCGKSTVIRGGDCHPAYVYCKESNSCVPLLYTACGYSEWLKKFGFEQDPEWLKGASNSNSLKMSYILVNVIWIISTLYPKYDMQY